MKGGRLIGLAFFLAANVVRMIFLWGTGDNTLIQADYAWGAVFLWGAIRLRLHRAVTLTGTFLVSLVAIAGDVVMIFGRRFRWGPDAVLDYMGAYSDLPWTLVLPVIALVLIAAGLSVSFLAFRRSTAIALWPLATVLGGLAITDAAVGESSFRSVRGNYNILTTSAVAMSVSIAARGLHGPALYRLNDATLDRAWRVEPPEALLSIAVESLGWPVDPERRQALLRPLLAPLARDYAVSVQSHHYYGATLAGEIRELCSLRLVGVPSKEGLLERLNTCLPARLRRLGYKTQALHGNGGLIYRRLQIYPAMGFERSWFYDQLRSADNRVGPCPGTVFKGACDRAVLARALSLFDGQRRLVHVMTLDTHLPLPSAGHGTCDPAFRADETLCAYSNTMTRSFTGIVQAVHNAARPPNVIVIYGDHAPPFALLSTRRFFSTDRVPFLVLRRRMSYVRDAPPNFNGNFQQK